MVAIATLRDAAGAEVAREMLAERGITVEIKRLGYNPYFGAPTAAEFEVRVPDDAVAEAQELLDGMAEELERAALAEAGVPPASDDERGGDELPPPELRPRKVAWAVALGLVGPIPGCGLLYGRAFAIGWTFVGLSLGIIATAPIVANEHALTILAALKALDILLAPFAAARFNRTLKQPKEPHAAQS